MWHTALLAPWFLSSALVCGTGLVLAVCIALRKVGYIEFEEENITKLAKMFGLQNMDSVTLDFIADLLLDMRDDKKKKKSKKEEG